MRGEGPGETGAAGGGGSGGGGSGGGVAAEEGSRGGRACGIVGGASAEDAVLLTALLLALLPTRAAGVAGAGEAECRRCGPSCAGAGSSAGGAGGLSSCSASPRVLEALGGKEGVGAIMAGPAGAEIEHLRWQLSVVQS